MFKNTKMSVAITGIVSVVSLICLVLVFLSSSISMRKVLVENAMNNMNTSLDAKTQSIEEYISAAEGQLLSF